LADLVLPRDISHRVHQAVRQNVFHSVRNLAAVDGSYTVFLVFVISPMHAAPKHGGVKMGVMRKSYDTTFSSNTAYEPRSISDKV